MSRAGTRPERHGGNGFFSAALPRSLQVEQVLRQRLQRELAPGGRFPSEPELTREFGVSRTLVRGVLSRLTREGLIRREARRGTFVSGRRGRSGTVPGPPAVWIRRIREVIAAGVEHVNIFLLTRDKLAMARRIVRDVLPHVRG